ncbi:MAG: hypothetical protein ACLSAP_05300 [Oscillospiraceae bacterium]
MVTDSQVFAEVYPRAAANRLTVLGAVHAIKGMWTPLQRGCGHRPAAGTDRVLIAEACTTNRSTAILRASAAAAAAPKAGGGLAVDGQRGGLSKDLSPYALVIHCGSCMFNRKYLLSRLARAREAGVPMTNYGMAIAKLTGILEKIDY